MQLVCVPGLSPATRAKVAGRLFESSLYVEETSHSSRENECLTRHARAHEIHGSPLEGYVQRRVSKYLLMLITIVTVVQV